MTQRTTKAEGRRGGRRRPTPRTAPSFRILLWAIALPAIAVILLLAWIGFRTSFSEVSKEPATPVAVDETPAASRPAPKSENVKPKRAAKPAVNREAPARIALILDDVGFDGQPLAAAAELDANISFAIIPFTPSAESSLRFLSARGFELLCHLPMEPSGYPAVKPGEGALMVSMSDEEIARATRSAIAAVPGVTGLNNHMGSKATADERIMRAALGTVREARLFFVDSKTSSETVAASVARSLDIATAERDVFLDDSRDRASIRRQLRRLAAVAKERRSAVGIGHVYPETIAVLREEMPRLRREGFVFVRMSEVVE